MTGDPRDDADLTSVSIKDALRPDHEHVDGCLCDVELAPGEETKDEHLPEAKLVPGLDKSPGKPRERRK